MFLQKKNCRLSRSAWLQATSRHLSTMLRPNRSSANSLQRAKWWKKPLTHALAPKNGLWAMAWRWLWRKPTSRTTKLCLVQLPRAARRMFRNRKPTTCRYWAWQCNNAVWANSLPTTSRSILPASKLAWAAASTIMVAPSKASQLQRIWRPWWRCFIWHSLICVSTPTNLLHCRINTWASCKIRWTLRNSCSRLVCRRLSTSRLTSTWLPLMASRLPIATASRLWHANTSAMLLSSHSSSAVTSTKQLWRSIANNTLPLCLPMPRRWLKMLSMLV